MNRLGNILALVGGATLMVVLCLQCIDAPLAGLTPSCDDVNTEQGCRDACDDACLGAGSIDFAADEDGPSTSCECHCIYGGMGFTDMQCEAPDPGGKPAQCLDEDGHPNYCRDPSNGCLPYPCSTHSACDICWSD